MAPASLSKRSHPEDDTRFTRRLLLAWLSLPTHTCMAAGGHTGARKKVSPAPVAALFCCYHTLTLFPTGTVVSVLLRATPRLSCKVSGGKDANQGRRKRARVDSSTKDSGGSWPFQTS